MKITIVGMGALGILYGERITSTLGKEAVTFLADARRVEKYQREGVYCNGKQCDFVVSDTAEIADLLIFAVKGTAFKEAMKLSRDAVGEDTILLSVLNGISSEEMMEAYFEKGHIVHCIAQGMDAVKLENRLTFANEGELRIGSPDKEKQVYVEKAAQILKKAGVPHVVEENIRHRLWCKWMLNVGVNQVVMVEEGTYATIQQQGEARNKMLAAMEEVRMLSKLAGTEITKEDMDAYVALVDSLNPEGMPSMRQDGLAKRPSEVDFFAGTVIQKAGEYGLKVPVNQSLYDTVKRMEEAY